MSYLNNLQFVFKLLKLTTANKLKFRFKVCFDLVWFVFHLKFLPYFAPQLDSTKGVCLFGWMSEMSEMSTIGQFA